MSATVPTGPIVSAGPLLGDPNAPDNNLIAGPSLFYQGEGILDPRHRIRGGNDRLGMLRSHALSTMIMNVDAAPAASAAVPVNIAPAANTVTGTPMTLATISAGATPGIPFLPYLVSTVQLSGITLDFGFTTVATTAGSATITPADMTWFYQGQQIVVGGAGAAGIAMIAKVVTVGTTTVTLNVSAGTTVAAAPVGSSNVLDPNSLATSIASRPYILGGYAALMNPAESVSRGVAINCSATGGGGAFLVSSYDIYGQPMSELITHPGGNVVAFGKKAHKHIVSVTPQFTDATRTYSVGTSDVIGFLIRNTRWEHNVVYVAGAELTTNTGWTAADVTSPATSTTGDVRGTIQVGTRGPLGSGAAGSINGTNRLVFYTMLSPFALSNASNAAPATMYGSTQA